MNDGDLAAVAQFLAEPRDQQQGVVRCGAEHENEQDALTLPVEGDDTGIGEEIHRQARQCEGKHRRDDHDERQDRAAVHGEQDQQHHTTGDEQQQPVDTGERGGQIGDLPGRAGDVHGQPVRRGGHPLTQFLHRRTDIAVAVDRHDQLGGPTVLGRDRWRTHRLGGEKRQVVGGDPGFPLGDDDGGHSAGIGELREQLVRASRLRRRGQERAVVVLRDLTELPGERATAPGDREPHEHQQCGQQPA